MAKTLDKMPTENPNTQEPLIPSPRPSGEGQSSWPPEPGDSIELFTTQVDEASRERAAAFLAELPSDTAIAATSIVQQLLEILGTLPTEMAAEEASQRERALAKISMLVFDDDGFKDEHGTVNAYRFNDDVIQATGREVISKYPIAELLLNAIKRSRGNTARNVESYRTEQLMIARRIALLGIARQLGKYPPKNES